MTERDMFGEQTMSEREREREGGEDECKTLHACKQARMEVLVFCHNALTFHDQLYSQCKEVVERVWRRQ